MRAITINPRLLSHRWRRNLDDYGWRVTLKKTLAYLLQPICFHQVYRVYRIRLVNENPRAATGSARPELAEGRKDLAGPDFRFRLITAQDADAIAQIERVAEWLSGCVKDRLAAGQLCLAILRGTEVVAFNLVSFGHVFMPLVRLEKRLRPGTAWSEHIAVRRGFRRMGLATRLRYRLFDELRQRGIRRLYAGTLRSNVASARMQESVGLQAIIDVHYRRILLFQDWQYEKVRP